MGMLVNGIWKEDADVATDQVGNYVRAASGFRDQISSSRANGFKAEANRYHLYVSHACPWSSRVLIMRSLKKLESVISLSVTDAFVGKNGWSFGKTGNETEDSAQQAHYLKEIYLLSNNHYTGRVSVPVLWDKQTKKIVNNESVDIMRMLNSEFNAFSPVAENYYPTHLKSEIDSINEFIYTHINNGVYKCGFAKTQHAYDEAFDYLFFGLNKIDSLLAKQRYLVGKTFTEADIRLFTTLIRFDVVYYSHFKCNLRRILDYPNLSGYLREIYQMPDIKKTVHFDHIKNHYYQSHLNINPIGIVPRGPEIDLEQPHRRGTL